MMLSRVNAIKKLTTRKSKIARPQSPKSTRSLFTEAAVALAIGAGVIYAYKSGAKFLTKSQLDVIFDKVNTLKLQSPEKWVLKPEDDKLVTLFPVLSVKNVVPPIVFQLDKKMWELYDVDTAVDNSQLVVRYIQADPLPYKNSSDGKTPQERYSAFINLKKARKNINLDKVDTVMVHVSDSPVSKITPEVKTVGFVKRYGNIVYSTYEICENSQRYTLVTERCGFQDSLLGKSMPTTWIYYSINSKNGQDITEIQKTEFRKRWCNELRPSWYTP